MTVQVIDGETRQPLPGAKVSVCYIHMLDFTAPDPVSGVTDERGIVTLRVGEHYGTQISAAHPAYFQLDPVRPTDGFVAALSRKGSGRVDQVLELWNTPGPTVELVIPVGYRGPVKVLFEPNSDAESYPPGQRTFTCRIDRVGRGTVKGPRFFGVLGGGSNTKFVARYEGGEPLPEDSKPDVVALRSVHPGYFDRPTRLFVIGTKAEAEAVHERTIRRLAPNHIQSDKDAYDRVFDE